VALRLAADRIRVSGFVIEGASVGIDSSDRFSGYRVDHNLIENNSLFGMDFGSVGGRESRVDHNCLRDNYYGLVSELDDDSLWKPSDGPERDPWNARDLSDARIDHNITVHDTTATDEGGGLAASGPGQHDRVSIDHNRLGDEVTGILLQHATRSAIVANDITSTHFAAILIGGASNALEIRANAIHGTTTAPGIFFEPRDFIDVFPTPSTDVLVSENDIHGMGAGIYARAASLTASLIEGNIASDNRGNGIETFSGGNVFRNNTADNNGVAGLTAFPGATGNRFEHNILHGNAFVGMGASFPAADARDLDAYVNGPFQNIWIDNDCDTDLPTGTICGA
jgi:parallel beta-helix repeat protein